MSKDIMQDMIEQREKLLADRKTIVEWFDPADVKHMAAFKVLQETGQWPDGFIPEGLEFPNSWIVQLNAKVPHLTEGILELVGEVEWMTPEDVQTVRKAVADGRIDSEWPSEEEMIDALSGLEDLVDPASEPGDVRLAYLRYIIVPKAISTAGAGEERLEGKVPSNDDSDEKRMKNLLEEDEFITDKQKGGKMTRKAKLTREGKIPSNDDSDEKRMKKLLEAPEDRFPEPDEEDEFSPEEEEPDLFHREEEPLDIDVDVEKLYLGRKEDTHFYMVADKGETGQVEDLKIVDQEGNQIISGKEAGLDLGDVGSFILSAIEDEALQGSQLERSIVLQYLVPKIKGDLEAEEEEELLEPGAGEEEELGEPEEEEEIPGPRESKNRRPRRRVRENQDASEMKVKDNKGNEFRVEVVDEGTADVVVAINGREFRFEPEFAAIYGQEKGRITDEALQTLALETLSHLNEFDYAEIVGAQIQNEDKINEITTWEDLGWRYKRGGKNRIFFQGPDLEGYTVKSPQGDIFDVVGTDEKGITVQREEGEKRRLYTGDDFVYNSPNRRWQLIDPEGNIVEVDKTSASGELKLMVSVEFEMELVHTKVLFGAKLVCLE